MPRRPVTNAVTDDADADVLVFPAARDSVSIDDHLVRRAHMLITLDGYADTVDGWCREGLKPGGATARVSTTAVLVGTLVCAYVHKTTVNKRIADVLFREISDDMRELIGVTTLDHHSTSDDARYVCANRALNRVFDAIDSSVLVRNIRHEKAKYSEMPQRRTLTDTEILQITTRRNWVANQLLGNTFRMLPRKIRRSYKGSLAVDGTLIEQYTERDTDEFWSADPECARYVRTSQTTGEIRKFGFGMEATLAVMTDDSACERTAFPKLVLGMILDKPGARVGENGYAVIKEAVDRTGVLHYVAGDRAYTNAIATKFQDPVRELGGKLVLDYRSDQLGVQGSAAGAKLIEGQLYCPSIPQALVEATMKYRTHRINYRQYLELLAERAKYLFKNKAAGRVACPSTGPSPTASCSVRDKFDNDRNKKPVQVSPNVDERRVPIKVLKVVAENPPTCCAQQTFTVPDNDALGKFSQELQYGTEQWHAQYSMMRNTNEGFNGSAKEQGLGDAKLRRNRGLAAQTLLCALLLAAVNIRRIKNFIDEATTDADGIDRVAKEPIRDRNRRNTDESDDTEVDTDWDDDDEAPPPID